MDLICCEWLNANRSAHSLKLKKNTARPQESSILYLLQIVGKQSGTEDDQELACLSSDQIISVYDQNNLKLVTQIKEAHLKTEYKTINEIGK